MRTFYHFEKFKQHLQLIRIFKLYNAPTLLLHHFSVGRWRVTDLSFEHVG
jgi:hypothetical protein